MDIIGEIESFYSSFKSEKGIFGKSGKGKNLYYFKVGKKKPIIVVSCCIHAREYITSYLCLKLIQDYYDLAFGSVYFLPCVNPDGVRICLDENPLYKANAFGVDLNVNFDCRWGSGKSNKRVPGSENYIGAFPFSESETRALRNLTLFLMPDLTISFHSKGEEIYYGYENQKKEHRKRDFELAKIIQSQNGYKIKTTFDSAGGYKDWCCEKLFIPSFTIEVGDDKLAHPITKVHLEDIYQKNKGVIGALMEKLWK